MRSARALPALPVVLALLAGGAACADDEPTPEPGGRDREPSAEPTVTVEQAPGRYTPLLRELVRAVDGVAAARGRPDERPASYYDDDQLGCVYSAGRYEFDDVFGESTSWDDVRAAVEPVLAPEGFELTGQLDIPGGHNGFDAVAEDGAFVQVRSKLGQASTISLDAPVDGVCPD